MIEIKIEETEKDVIGSLTGLVDKFGFPTTLPSIHLRKEERDLLMPVFKQAYFMSHEHALAYADLIKEMALRLVVKQF